MREFFPAKENTSHAWLKSPKMTDEEVIAKLRMAKNKEKFTKLFDHGNTKDCQGSRSEADLSLVSMIAFYTQDPKQIDRIFRKSRLGRKKWLDREDYRQRTINKALSGLNATYRSSSTAISSEKIDFKEAEILALKILGEDDPCKDFTIEYLPTQLRDYISIKCEPTEASPIMITQSILCATSAFLKTKCFIPNGGYFQNLYPNVWVLNINDSRNFKTTALNSGLSMCRIQEKTLDQLYKELQILEEGKDKNTKEDIQRIESELSKKSVCLPHRVTVEALIYYLSKNYSGLISCSEFGAWLGSLETSYNRDLRALFTDFYNVPTSYVCYDT